MKNTSKENLLIIALGLVSLTIGAIFLWQTAPAKTPATSETSVETQKTTENIQPETQPLKTDDRISLTLETLQDYNSPSHPQCDEKFNDSPANTTVPYSNKKKGISFDIPYNSNWGNEKFKIEPYWEEEDLIYFGSLKTFQACMWTRFEFVEFKPQLSAEEVVNKVQESELPELIPVKPTIIEINGMTIVKYAMSGMCDYPALQIIGETYNYEFRSGCSVNIEEDFKYLEEIVKSVKLL